MIRCHNASQGRNRRHSSTLPNEERLPIQKSAPKEIVNPLILNAALT